MMSLFLSPGIEAFLRNAAEDPAFKKRFFENPKETIESL